MTIEEIESINKKMNETIKNFALDMNDLSFDITNDINNIINICNDDDINLNLNLLKIKINDNILNILKKISTSLEK